MLETKLVHGWRSEIITSTTSMIDKVASAEALLELLTCLRSKTTMALRLTWLTIVSDRRFVQRLVLVLIDLHHEVVSVDFSPLSRFHQFIRFRCRSCLLRHTIWSLRKTSASKLTIQIRVLLNIAVSQHVVKRGWCLIDSLAREDGLPISTVGWNYHCFLWTNDGLLLRLEVLSKFMLFYGHILTI